MGPLIRQMIGGEEFQNAKSSPSYIPGMVGVSVKRHSAAFLPLELVMVAQRDTRRARAWQMQGKFLEGFVSLEALTR